MHVQAWHSRLMGPQEWVAWRCSYAPSFSMSDTMVPHTICQAWSNRQACNTPILMALHQHDWAAR
eukprot:765226-Pelagomonas_calceolata.AAC.1